MASNEPSPREESTPLIQRGYYGRNDMKPMPWWKLIPTYIILIVLSPILLVLMLLFALIFCCYKLSPHQMSSMKVFKILEPWYKAPGERFATQKHDEKTTDICIPMTMVDDTKCLRTCGGLGTSLRKSLEHTVDSHIREGLYGKQVVADTDVNRPHYFLNGSLYKYDPSYDELWASAGRMCQWPALYSWSGHSPAGNSCCTASEIYCCDDKIPMDSLPDVLGYIYFLELSNPNYYDKPDRVEKVGFTPNCPPITPQNEGKVFARYGYMDAYGFGNLKTDGSEPDAYIFKGKALEEANMKLLHTYRILKPSQPNP
eukprot:TRINITY_DN6132_c0_g1_i1.p1 TRINITY_DN6132_c0_g1~~TRINITY_DN6132_c0_g1_i1.p1  ORF type:complete len:314 (-),score=42.02 TRINITY_DN6132_c0_g1_i1:299-1240(-)